MSPPLNDWPPHSSTVVQSKGSLWNQEVRVMSPSGDYVTPATHLPFGTNGPAIWSVQNQDELEAVLHKLLVDRLERRSRAHAALQGAARFAIGLVQIEISGIQCSSMCLYRS